MGGKLKDIKDSITYNKILNLVGETVKYLTVLGFSHTSEKVVSDKRVKSGYYTQTIYWVKCKCICGEETVINFYSLGRTTGSCGCVNGADSRRKYNDPLEANAIEAFKFYSKNKPGNLTFEQFLELAKKNCHYCGSPPSNITRGSTKKGFRYDNPFIYSGLDRIDSLKPHDYENCVPCCYYCNVAKSDRTVEEFMMWIEKIYTLRKENE